MKILSLQIVLKWFWHGPKGLSKIIQDSSKGFLFCFKLAILTSDEPSCIPVKYFETYLPGNSAAAEFK